MGIFRKIRERIREFKFTMRAKIILSLSSVAVTLLSSSLISVLEYSRMSSYVSELIADNIHSINVAQRLANVGNAYNLEILAVIGDESRNRLPEFNQGEFLNHCDSLRASLTSVSIMPLADSVVYSYSAYMLASLELRDVILSDFIDSRTWYFERLQPVYNRFGSDIANLNTAIYNELQKNSATFERGFYRSIIPGAVAVGVGLMLVLLLLFFILVYYVNPLYRMLQGLDSYRAGSGKYGVAFEGDDQLAELNEGITEVTEENRLLRRRVKSLRESVAKYKARESDKVSTNE